MDHFDSFGSTGMDAVWTGPCGWPAAAATTGGGQEATDLRRGPWTMEEDALLAGHIAKHGEGRWNELASAAGLRRTGKSCRLRWLNYLRPDVRRGDFTPQEQLLILELHFRWGKRWSRIAREMPGRTDNEIKNYWRTRVQKHAKQLKCDVDSRQFRDVMRHLWMPRLLERIQAAAAATPAPSLEHAASPVHPLSVAPACRGGIGMCHSPETTTVTTSSTAGSSVSLEVHFPSNQLVLTAGSTTNWSGSGSDQCGSASARSDDMLDGSWSELLARACDDGADSVVFPHFELGGSGDDKWSLEDIWSQHHY
ncbi:hypothetical protein CFC21_037497 [Triticum aestivum]|uniref:Uncharacterized protein n=3 Tax=Triticum TaxID=4564 RepID=A0A9R0RVE7_TRITD|nr:transcription factor JAMYB-like [Triticum aestivum]KAF7025294.1 hypothetical protein CFC21_037497 [Triticum aestivum]VAH67535.1 unnamed protein product [Triticum turgidum subsp. durum]